VVSGEKEVLSMITLGDAGVVEQVTARLSRLTPSTPRQWGRMTAPQMLCHLSDSLLVVLGERQTPSRVTFQNRHILRHLALRLPAKWPQGVATGPDVDQERGGTPPAEFQADRERLIRLTQRFRETPAGQCAPHPAFGRLSRWELLRWAYLHADHHLRQFGV
jgi:hypothetical protein